MLYAMSTVGANACLSTFYIVGIFFIDSHFITVTYNRRPVHIFVHNVSYAVRINTKKVMHMFLWTETYGELIPTLATPATQ